MKRTLSLAFALALAATLSACDRDGTNAGSGATSGSSGSSAGSSSSGSSGSMGSGSTLRKHRAEESAAPARRPGARLEQVTRLRGQRTRVRVRIPDGAKRRTSSALGAGSFSCARSR